MFKPMARAGLACLCSVFIVGASAAETSSSELSWGAWLGQQVDKHPEVMAAKERMNAAFSTAESREQATYNPELESEYEFYDNDESDNYRIGISQTIDLWDKRGARTEQASFNRVAAKNDYRARRQQQMSEVLLALSEWRADRQLAEFSTRQEEQLNTLLSLVEQRQRSGDLGQIDAELAFLGLSQTLNSTALAHAARVVSEARVRELLLGWSPMAAKIPESFWREQGFSAAEKSSASTWLEQHPAVVTARASWQAEQQAAVLAERDAKADPTLGLSGGQDAGDNVVGLSFSMPLNIRNTYRAQVRAAEQQVLAAEADFLAVRRQQQYSIQSSAGVLREYQMRLQRWQSLNKARAKSSGELLQKQWRSGDLSTAEYLLALQQRADGLAAGIELRQSFEAARINWLLNIGQLDQAIAKQ